MKKNILKAHKAAYPDPIVLCKGEKFTPTERTDNWENNVWIWSIAQNGKEGWVPGNLPIIANAQTVAAYDYNAKELDAKAGEFLTILSSNHGWAWCRNEQNDEGWVPQNCFYER